MNMKKELKLYNKNITIYYSNTIKKAPVIILNSYDENTLEIFNKVKELTDKEFIFISISNINWNSEMSPWYMDKLYKNEDNYSGNADEYLNILAKNIIPEIEEFIKKELKINISYYAIAGYSLAGLFAIYSLYKTDMFKRVICCSGSLWYPNFINFIKEHELVSNPDKIYFSLGNKESNTKNEMLATVEDNTKLIVNYFSDKGIETIYEVNEGNHFQNVSLRIVKAIVWILN